MAGGGGHRRCQLDQQRAQQVSDDHDRSSAPLGVVQPGKWLRAQVEPANLDLDAVLRRILAGGLDALELVVHAQHRVKPSRAAAIASTPEPVPKSSSGPAAPSREASSRSSSRHMRVVAWPPVPNA